MKCTMAVVLNFSSYEIMNTGLYFRFSQRTRYFPVIFCTDLLTNSWYHSCSLAHLQWVSMLTQHPVKGVLAELIRPNLSTVAAPLLLLLQPKLLWCPLCLLCHCAADLLVFLACDSNCFKCSSQPLAPTFTGRHLSLHPSCEHFSISGWY